jgi:trimeric autotransporter adhesin
MHTTFIRNTISCSPLRPAFLLIPLVLGCFGLSPIAQATDSGSVLPNGNTGDGSGVLTSLTTGTDNSGFGFQALFHDTSGSFNTAAGWRALFSNTINISGQSNTANGFEALYSNTTESENTASGYRALFSNTAGHDNTALGVGAGQNLTTGTNNIDIGNGGVAGEGSTIRIGSSSQIRTFIAGISGIAVTGATVHVNAAGQLGVAPSARRFKEEIKPMGKESEAIFALKPVSFHYKKEIDPDRTPQFGLVAEEVEKVNPDLVTCDANGDVYSVRYEAVNAMMLNEFLKEHRKVQEHDAPIAQLASMTAQHQKELELLTARLKEQASQLQKLSTQVGVSKSAPQIVLNNQ